MSRFFGLEETADPFVPFSTPHLMAIVVLFLCIAALIIFREKLREEKPNRYFRYTVAALFITVRLILNIWKFHWGLWSLETSLPFHLCNIGVICCTIMMFTKSHKIFEIIYFWGLIGAFLAMVTPDLKITYTHYNFWQFMIAHGLIVISVLFMAIVERHRPYVSSIKKAFVIANILLVVVGGINLLVDGNYLFICHYPEGAAGVIFKLFGPWPWYIVTLEILALAFFLLYYSPYWIMDMREKRKMRAVPVKGLSV